MPGTPSSTTANACSATGVSAESTWITTNWVPFLAGPVWLSPNGTHPGHRAGVWLMWAGRGLAMLCTGAEEYGVATVQRTLAEAWPDMVVVCLGPGGQTEWMRTHVDNLREVHGLATWSRSD